MLQLYMGFNFKKELGQHFLRQVPKELLFPLDDLESIKSLQTSTHIRIVEIGPGNGVVTEALIKQLYPFSKFEIIYEVIDVDREALDATKERILEFNLPKRFNMKYILNDILKHKIKAEPNEFVYIFGSLPYNISKKIVNWASKQISLFPSRTTALPSNFLIQKEVAEDYASKPPKAAFIGMALQQHAERVKITRKVPPGAFYPPPKVDSAIIKIEWDGNLYKNFEKNEKLIKIIKQGFSAKRKMIGSIFRKQIPKEKLTPTLEQILHMRAQELSESEWIMVRDSLGD